MKTEAVTVNNIVIECPVENGVYYVTIRPICEALGIDFKSQYAKLKDDDNLSSVMVLSTTTGADGKNYERFCLPLK